MPYPPTCCECSTKTFILWDGKAWCRQHYLEAQDRALADRRLTAET